MFSITVFTVTFALVICSNKESSKLVGVVNLREDLNGISSVLGRSPNSFMSTEKIGIEVETMSLRHVGMNWSLSLWSAYSHATGNAILDKIHCNKCRNIMKKCKQKHSETSAEANRYCESVSTLRTRITFKI